MGSFKCPVHGIPDCSPLLNGCNLVIEHYNKVVPIRPLLEYVGVQFPEYGDGPIVFSGREELREYIAGQQASALLEAASASDTEWLRFKTDGWGSNDADVQTINFAVWAKNWLIERADALLEDENEVS